MTENLIFALDIGTRSVIGVVGRAERNGLHVLAIERQEHETRAMVDGQIQNIDLVAQVAAAVRQRLEARVGQPLREVCVAAAGRSLKTQHAEYEIVLPAAQLIDAETVARLETEAINRAEQAFEEQENDNNRLYYLVGYSVTSYELDHYPMTSLLDHRGGQIKVSLIATFLPSEVVESLCMAMTKAGMQVTNLTLEPIAAMNLVIPPQLRLLNLALVDIGAGTSDIAISSGGSVIGYTMATIAGDEITEAIMKQYLLDFDTAERIKLQMSSEETIHFSDILGIEHTVSVSELEQVTDSAAAALGKEICDCVRALNEKAPSAIFLVGGGSQLPKLRQYVEQELQMDATRVAVGGSNFKVLVTAEDDGLDLCNPELVTPLGIAFSAAQNMTAGGLHVTINGKRANLFRSDQLSIRDVLMMNGYRYRDFIGRSGASIAFTLDGRRQVIRGTQSQPAELVCNGQPAALSDRVRAGDTIVFVPAMSGSDACATVIDVVPGLSNETIELDGKDIHIGLIVCRDGVRLDANTPIVNGDVLETIHVQSMEQLICVYDLHFPLWLNGTLCEQDVVLSPGDLVTTTQPEQSEIKPSVNPDQPADDPSFVPQSRMLSITLNDKPIQLTLDDTHKVYYLMDLLEYSQIDFDNLQSEVHLEVNGQEAMFQQPIMTGDQIRIYEKPRQMSIQEGKQ